MKLFQDALSHRNQMIHNVEVYSHQHHEEYQEHVNTEMEYMRASLVNAHNMLNEQSQALAEAHLMDEGSTMRIIELGKRVELAEQGTAHIIQDSIAMRERDRTELESAARQFREQHEQSETAAAQFRRSGLQLREACTQYVNDREKANKEEMESLAMMLEANSQELTMNNEMVMEHGRQAVALRDEGAAEMQVAINELSESLAKKDEIIEQKDRRIKEQGERIRKVMDDSGHRATLSEMDIYALKLRKYQLEERSEAEVVEKEFYLERYERQLADTKESAFVEQRLQSDRELSLENAILGGWTSL